MSQDWLRVAGDMAERAAEEADDGAAAERLRDLAEQLRTLAERDRGPDHGRLARIENILDEVNEQVNEAASEQIQRAHEEVVRYRETVEGV
ncbi:DUF7553 family protein [Halorarius halobius]|uniref:DUF7553 family protein n=1 Tax=Halorarius halobius TaxID=2962671 RepID=UPI0020CFDBA1|nr:hypothetical protein [Halorarius halobius]